MRIVTVCRHSLRVDGPETVESVEWFPRGSEYLRAPHWHVRYPGGFRTNVPASLHELISAE